VSQGCTFLPAGDGEATLPHHRAFTGPHGLDKTCQGSATSSDDSGYVFWCVSSLTTRSHPQCHPSRSATAASNEATPSPCLQPQHTATCT
jgi:hypothetical protein